MCQVSSQMERVSRAQRAPLETLTRTATRDERAASECAVAQACASVERRPFVRRVREKRKILCEYVHIAHDACTNSLGAQHTTLRRIVTPTKLDRRKSLLLAAGVPGEKLERQSAVLQPPRRRIANRIMSGMPLGEYMRVARLAAAQYAGTPTARSSDLITRPAT